MKKIDAIEEYLAGTIEVREFSITQKARVFEMKVVEE